METITDPRNEMVLFRFKHYWEAIGPVSANLADETVRWCISNEMAAFICLDEEFEKFGKPGDPEAKDYFEKPPEWWPSVTLNQWVLAKGCKHFRSGCDGVV